VAALLAAVALAGTVLVPATAQATPVPAGKAPFVSFQAFLSSVSGARYASMAASGEAGAVRSPAALAQMQSYVLNLYKGVRVTHSFIQGGNYFDCVVSMTQPAVRMHNIGRIATPPPAPRVQKLNGKAARSVLTLGLHDAYGNAIACPRGTVPMERLSLDRLTKFRTLRDFMAKPSGRTITPGGPHRYAVGYQWVNNYGDTDTLGLWNPSGEFTLSQTWIVSEASTVQTAEAGWVHYPAKFGNNSVLFSYYTADDYQSTGCWNQECGAFVAYVNNTCLGCSFSNYSTFGGTQWEYGEQYEWWQGNWWLAVQGQWIGYYPGSDYLGGPMNSGNANLTEFGGETYTGGTYWPQMGSGDWAEGGFGYSGYQHNLVYMDQSYNTWNASLSPIVTNPNCYDYQYHDSSEGSSWGTYFYFGGPGGYC
jgi:hypothetical protein